MGKYDWNAMKDTLQEGLENKKNDWNDPREWKLQRDDNDNGTAIIRLLPGKGGTTPPVIRLFEHGPRQFNKATNKYRYYIEPSPSTIKKPCPISELWYELGKIGTDEAKKLQKDISRRTVFISNILVVNDPANEDNNGKIFYWKYGVKLFEKFQAALEPTEAQIKVGKKPVQLFDPMEGANIMLQSKNVANFVNYDDTTIEAPTQAFDSEADADRIVDEDCIDLTEFTDEGYFKSYDDLLGKIRWTFSGTPIEALSLQYGSQVIVEAYDENKKGAQTQSKPKEDSATPMGSSTPKAEPKPEPKPAPKAEAKPEPKPEPKPAPKEEKPAPAKTGGDDEDIMDMINSL